MKKSLFILALSLLLVGCSDTTEETVQETQAEVVETAAEETQAETVEETVEETEAETVAETGSSLELGKTVVIGDWNVTPTEFKVVQDSEGLNGLRVTYTAENIGEEDNTPGFALIFRGFQDGVETGDDFFVSDDVDFGIGQVTLKPGGKLEGIHEVIDIKDLSKPLLVELIETFSFDDTKYETTIEDLSIYQ